MTKKQTAEKGRLGELAVWFRHIAREVPGEDGHIEWCEPISDEAHGRLMTVSLKGGYGI